MEQSSEKAISKITIDKPEYVVQFSKEFIQSKELTEHRIIIYASIYKTIPLVFSQIRFSLYLFMKECKQPTNKATIAMSDGTTFKSRFAEVLNWLTKQEYLVGFNEKTFIGNLLQTGNVNKDKFFNQTNYGLIYNFEIKEIMTLNTGKHAVNNSVILLTLSYIRQQLEVKESERIESGNAILHLSEMYKMLGIKRKAVLDAVDILVKMGILIEFDDIYRDCPTFTFEINNKIYGLAYHWYIDNNQWVLQDFTHCSAYKNTHM